MVITAIEGGIVISKALGEPCVTGQQVRMVRDYVKLLYTSRPGV